MIRVLGIYRMETCRVSLECALIDPQMRGVWVGLGRPEIRVQARRVEGAGAEIMRPVCGVRARKPPPNSPLPATQTENLR